MEFLKGKLCGIIEGTLRVIENSAVDIAADILDDLEQVSLLFH